MDPIALPIMPQRIDFGCAAILSFGKKTTEVSVRYDSERAIWWFDKGQIQMVVDSIAITSSQSVVEEIS